MGAYITAEFRRARRRPKCGTLRVVLWTAAMTEDQEDGVALTMSEPPFQLEVDPGMAGRAAP
jgi:hypothetical protein